MRRQNRTATYQEIRVANVVEGTSRHESEGSELVYTADALELQRRDEERVSITHESVAGTRVDVDESTTGFKPIALLFGFVAVVFGYVCTSSLHAGFRPASVVVLGTGASAVLASVGTAWLWRLDGAARRVLAVSRTDGTQVVFSTCDDDGAFDEIASQFS